MPTSTTGTSPHGGCAHTRSMEPVKRSAVVLWDPDELVLARLGYKQELHRLLGRFSSFGLSLTVMSPLMGTTGLFIVGWSYGGPLTIVWGWVIVSLFVSTVGLSMAEICSAYPTSGSVYYWASRLGGKHGRFFGWLTGWLNLLGLMAAVASANYVTTTFITEMLLLGTGTFPTNAQALGIFAAVLVTQGILNTVGVHLLGVLAHVGTYWQVTGIITLTIALPVIAPTHQSTEFVFTQFYPNKEVNGLPSSAYVFLVGLLMAQWSIAGYDTAPHLIEETSNAQISGAFAIIGSILATIVLGFAYLLSLLFSIQDVSNLLGETALASPTGGYMPPAQIFYDACQARWGGGAGRIGALIFLSLPLGGAFFATAVAVASASRMMFACSRDGSVPGSSLWHKVHPTFKVPVNAVWCCVGCGFLLALPMLASPFAFNAVTSMCTISLYASYGLPILLRLTLGRGDLMPGPFTLGVWSIPVASVACIWMAFVVAIFVLPVVYPVDMLVNFNYAPIAFGGVLLFCIGWWALDAHRWFAGPVRMIEIRGESKSSSALSQADQQTASGQGAASSRVLRDCV